MRRITQRLMNKSCDFRASVALFPVQSTRSINDKMCKITSITWCPIFSQEQSKAVVCLEWKRASCFYVFNEPTTNKTAVGNQENKALLVWSRIRPWWMRLCLVHIFSNTHVSSATFWSNISLFWWLCISIHILHNMVAVTSDRQLAERRPETNFLKDSHHTLISALRQVK